MQTTQSIPKLATRKKLPALRIGELLIKEGFIQNSDLKRALEVQKRGAQEASQPLGELMVKNKMISGPDLDRLLNHPDLRKNLGTLLKEKNLIGEKKLQ
ncbi:MAG: hypothetical protein PVI60_12125, partial [Desulfobacteraceae bacterium]